MYAPCLLLLFLVPPYFLRYVRATTDFPYWLPSSTLPLRLDHGLHPHTTPRCWLQLNTGSCLWFNAGLPYCTTVVPGLYYLWTHGSHCPAFFHFACNIRFVPYVGCCPLPGHPHPGYSYIAFGYTGLRALPLVWILPRLHAGSHPRIHTRLHYTALYTFADSVCARPGCTHPAGPRVTRSVPTTHHPDWDTVGCVAALRLGFTLPRLQLPPHAVITLRYTTHYARCRFPHHTPHGLPHAHALVYGCTLVTPHHGSLVVRFAHYAFTRLHPVTGLHTHAHARLQLRGRARLVCGFAARLHSTAGLHVVTDCYTLLYALRYARLPSLRRFWIHRCPRAFTRTDTFTHYG